MALKQKIYLFFYKVNSNIITILIYLLCDCHAKYFLYLRLLFAVWQAVSHHALVAVWMVDFYLTRPYIGRTSCAVLLLAFVSCFVLFIYTVKKNYIVLQRNQPSLKQVFLQVKHELPSFCLQFFLQTFLSLTEVDAAKYFSVNQVFYFYLNINKG